MNGAPNSVGGGGNAPGLGRTGSGGTGAGVGSGGASTTTITLNNGTRWIERATLAEAKGSVRAVEFAPRHFGLKIVSCLIIIYFISKLCRRGKESVLFLILFCGILRPI